MPSRLRLTRKRDTISTSRRVDITELDASPAFAILMSHTCHLVEDFDDDLDVQMLLIDPSRDLDPIARATRRTDALPANVSHNSSPDEFEHVVEEESVDVALFSPSMDWSVIDRLLQFLVSHHPFCGTVLVTDSDELRVVRRATELGIDLHLPALSSIDELEEWMPWVVRQSLTRARTSVIQRKVDESGHSGIVCLDRDLRIRYYNRRAQQDMRDLKGGSLAMREDARESLGVALDSFQRGCWLALHGESLTCEVTVRRDGDEHDLECIYEPLDPGSDHPSGGVYVGISDVEVCSDARDLEAEHAERMRALGQLAGGVAHDFNNLLSIVMSYAHLLEHNVETRKASRYITKIFEAAERGSRLADQLLAFGRNRSSTPELLQINDVIRDFEDMLDCLMPEDITLELALAPSAPRVQVDRRRIEQVLMNLALNARDAMSDGGTLTIETNSVSSDTDERLAELDAEQGLEWVVRDTGCGIEETVQTRIFETFFTTKEHGRGTGLGLSTVYGIVVDQYEGDIRVESHPGEGTEFTILLPADTTTDATPSVERPALEGDEAILVLDDDDSLRASTQTVLEQHGYTVWEASTVEEARAIGGREALDLLVVDAPLSRREEEQGVEVVTPSLERLDILWMTDGPDGDDLSEPRRTEAVLEKPFTMEALCEEIRRLLDAS